MKKLYLFLTVLVLTVVTSCEKINLPDNTTVTTTYTFTDNKDLSSAQQYITNWTDQIREYDASGSCIATNTIHPLSQRSQKFTANSNAVKVKIYVDLTFKPGSGFTQKKKWIQQVYYLEKGGNTNIIIDNNTLIGLNEP